MVRVMSYEIRILMGRPTIIVCVVLQPSSRLIFVLSDSGLGPRVAVTLAKCSFKANHGHVRCKARCGRCGVDLQGIAGASMASAKAEDKKQLSLALSRSRSFRFPYS